MLLRIPASFNDQRVRSRLGRTGLDDTAWHHLCVVYNGKHIGYLTELQTLHCYGDRALGHPLLRKVPPAIAKCRALRELLLNQNELVTLPVEMTVLDQLEILSLGENRLKLDGPLKVWADRFDPDWAGTQQP